MRKKPLISVVMSVYNDEEYIKEALDSLLAQTLDDFEVIIVDDCSSDRTAEVIEGYREERFRLIRNERNMGLTCNLNRAVAEASGEYIARMDGDDICLPERFEKQVGYLKENRNLMLISCRTQMFGAQQLISRVQGSPEELKVMMLVRPVLAHPGFMMRGELVREYGMRYDETYRSAQDYDFAVRVAEQFDIGITPEILLKYRVHGKQVSSSRSKEQMDNADRVRKRQLDRLGVRFEKGQEELYSLWAQEASGMDAGQFCRTEELIRQIAACNHTKGLYDQKVLERALRELLYTWVIRNRSVRAFSHVFSICRRNPGNLILFMRQLWEIARNKW